MLLGACSPISSQLTTYDIPKSCSAVNPEMEAINKRLGRIAKARGVKKVVAGVASVAIGVPISSVTNKISISTDTDLERLRFLGYYRMVYCGS